MKCPISHTYGNHTDKLYLSICFGSFVFQFFTPRNRRDGRRQSHGTPPFRCPQLGRSLWRDRSIETGLNAERGDYLAFFRGCHEDTQLFLTKIPRSSTFWLVVGHPSEKYERQLGWLFPIYGKIKNVPNHQPAFFPCFEHVFERTKIWVLFEDGSCCSAAGFHFRPMGFAKSEKDESWSLLRNPNTVY